jgi:hypothetical protein
MAGDRPPEFFSRMDSNGTRFLSFPSSCGQKEVVKATREQFDKADLPVPVLCRLEFTVTVPTLAGSAHGVCGENGNAVQR